eukprot:tig00020564_g11424.t1
MQPQQRNEKPRFAYVEERGGFDAATMDVPCGRDSPAQHVHALRFPRHLSQEEACDIARARLHQRALEDNAKFHEGGLHSDHRGDRAADAYRHFLLNNCGPRPPVPGLPDYVYEGFGHTSGHTLDYAEGAAMPEAQAGLARRSLNAHRLLVPSAGGPVMPQDVPGLFTIRINRPGDPNARTTFAPACEEFQSSTGYRIIIPEGMSHEEAVSLVITRLEQRRADLALAKPKTVTPRHRAKARAYMEFLEAASGTLPEVDRQYCHEFVDQARPRIRALPQSIL